MEAPQTPEPPAAREQLRVAPPKRVMLVPVGLGVDHLPNGETHMNFVISPFEAVTIVLSAQEDKDELIRGLTGGIAIARAGEVPGT